MLLMLLLSALRLSRLESFPSKLLSLLLLLLLGVFMAASQRFHSSWPARLAPPEKQILPQIRQVQLGSSLALNA